LVLTLNITLNRVDYARTGTWEEHSSISITASNHGLIWLAEPGGPGGMKKLKAEWLSVSRHFTLPVTCVRGEVWASLG
jgi:hypothetical protein